MIRRILPAIALSALAACSSTPTRYYTLSPVPPQGAAAPATGLSIAVAPVTLPEGVDRFELVVRTADNRVDILDNDRWAEPLRQDIARVFADDLAQRLPAARIAAYPQYASRDATYTVLLDVQRFESTTASATLDVRWTVRREGDKQTLYGRETITEPATGGNEGLAAAHSRALGRLADIVAGAIRSNTGAPVVRP
ncbi:membrane integrity-associated transporter subunit PqiC [Uliginosibacterium sp. sgz301328]|uniref:PqiC family protein n=1 Tax=Uliginosibacterium sp. sgz301328 TaxID=3243764 RepID=UPI00359E9B88